MSSSSNSRVLGIMLMVIALVFFVLLDISAKYLSAFFPVPFLVWSRFTGNFALNVVQTGLAQGGFSNCRTLRLRLHLLRSAMLCTTTFLYFFAVKNLSLSVAISIFFLYPLFIAALAPFLIGERLPANRWGFILAGFVGFLIVVQPGTDSFEWPMLFPVGAAFTFSLYSILTRKLANTEPIQTTHFYTALVGAVVLLPSLLLLGGDWEAPTNPWHWALALSMGAAFGGVGHIFLLHAHRFMPAPELAPWFYTHVLWTAAADYFFFDNIPTANTIIGCGVIVASSLFVLQLELRTARRLAAAQTVSGIN